MRRALLLHVAPFSLALGALGAAVPALAQDQELAHRPIVAIDLLERNGGRPEFSAQGDRIAFDRAGDDGRYDIHLLEVETGLERCLTCEVYDLKKTNNLAPAWHPSGRYLVFLAQGLAKRLGLGTTELVTPDRGVHADLFVIRLDGKGFWQLTRDTGAILDPHFSYEGDKLVWSERVGAGGDGHWGEWAVRLAKFDGDGKVPRLKGVRTFRPGEQHGLIVVHGFAPDDRRILLSGNLEEGQRETGSDIYLFDPETETLERLTHSRSNWDDDAAFAPNGQFIAFTSNAEILGTPTGTGVPAVLRRDLWLMKPDGSDQRRLTYFNDPRTPEGLGDAYVGDFSWAPAGDRIVVHVVAGSPPREDLYLIRLTEEFRR